MEQMDDQVHKIEEDPASPLNAFDMVRRKTGRIHGPDYTVGNPADMCIRRAGRDDEVVSGIAQAAKVDHLELDPLAVVNGVNRQSQRGREPICAVISHGRNRP